MLRIIMILLITVVVVKTAVSPAAAGNLPRAQCIEMPNEVIGRGAFGVVYLGEMLDGGEVVAIKRLNSKNPADFKREARMLRRMSHQLIPSFYGVIVDEMGCKIVMKRIIGESLEKIIFRDDSGVGRPIVEDLIPQSIADLLSAVTHMHHGEFVMGI